MVTIQKSTHKVYKLLDLQS